MTDLNHRFLPALAADALDSDVSQGGIMFVGSANAAASGASGQEVDFVRFKDIAWRVAGHPPDLIVSPVLGKWFDCLEVAQVLSELGFKGRYRAVSEQLPAPRIVRDEVRALCPGLDFDILLAPENAANRPC